MPSTIVNSSSGGGSISPFMSCVRESSPQESIHDRDTEKHGPPKKSFWNFTKWFRRRNNKITHDCINSEKEVNEFSEQSKNNLDIEESLITKKSGATMYPGLSLSHDSIFQSPQSGTDLEIGAAQSTSSLYIHQSKQQTELRLHNELNEKLRLRRSNNREDTSEDDEGLPQSPCNSPSTTESLLGKIPTRDHTTKSRSTCSDGSLLSMDSSDTEEDISVGLQYSLNSSKISLNEKKTGEQDSEMGVSSISSPLNHAAAHHRVAVRPKRTHAVPKRKKTQQLNRTTLPTTPEINEDLSVVRSLTPDVTKGVISEEKRLKCSSLPPGLARPEDMIKLSRSKSSVGSKSHSIIATLDENEEVEEKSASIFGRLFPRRSGKKKKNVQLDTSTPKSDFKNVWSINTNDQNTDLNFTSLLTPSPKFSQQIKPDFNFTSPKCKDTHIKVVEVKEEFGMKEEHKNKPKFAGLSPLQRRVIINHGDESEEKSFKSLTEFSTFDSTERHGIIKKSHSFKSDKEITQSNYSYLSMKADSSKLDDVTVCGPSHTAVIPVCRSLSENLQVQVPEFLNIQLNKVDPKPSKNVVLTTNPTSISKVKTEETIDTKETTEYNKRRKFSRDEIEIFENNENSQVLISGQPQDDLKTLSSLKNKSNSLEIVDCIKKSCSEEVKNKSLQNNLDKIDSNKQEIGSNSSRTSSVTSLPNNSEGVILRRKSVGINKKDDEPELMKVFARRSLKIKDEDQDLYLEEFKNWSKDAADNSKSRDSDKENQIDSPLICERKISFEKNSKDSWENNKTKEIDTSLNKETYNTDPDVILRKPISSKVQRFSQSALRDNCSVKSSHKYCSLVETPKTDMDTVGHQKWNNVQNKRNLKDERDNKVSRQIIEDKELKKEDLEQDCLTLPKNFIQRKAEWEKRAQEALKKKQI